ncbi:MAG: phosphodiester glycosidase family protein [Myxococcota bacterium]|nr:phosphodiester glycosidase family protein [Myxococcota bacterium]
MVKKRVFLLAGIIAAGAALYAAKVVQDPTPKLGSQGLQLVAIPSLGAEVFYLDAASIVKRGPPRMLVVRFAGPVDLVPHHFAKDAMQRAAPIEEWSERLQAPIVFNAGQFDEKLNHLGWLKADGAWLFSDRKSQWKGLLVSGPVEGGAFGGIIDLEHASPNITDAYLHVVQSMMLIDEESQVRVRDTDKTACRTVVAQDDKGRLLILVSEGAITLGDLARWLGESNLGIARAMNLDGGIEAQIAISTPELKLALYGQYGTGTNVFENVGPVRFPLPAVIAVRAAKVPAK